jgi:predicted ATPase
LKQKLIENETELSKLKAIVDQHQKAAERSTYEKKRKGLAIEKLKQLLYSYQREIPEDFDKLEALAGAAFSSSGNGKKYIAQMLKEHIDEQFPDALQELKLVDVSKNVEVTHRDVGIGISQVLPVLVMAYGSRGKLLAMEQPEIHLHPALQAELGDVFIESALGERQNTFILETHSEHLILRLMRRIREGKLSPDDISVVFVEPLSRGSRFVELRIDEEGDFIDEWPGGFFEESFHEKFGGR